MSDPFDVCCVGQMCTDVFVGTVAEVPASGQMVFLDEATLSIGGCGLNTAVGLAALGARTELLGKTGDDGYGAVLRNTLALTDVNVDGLRFETGAQSSMSVVLIDPSGERSILHVQGTNATLGYDDIDFEKLAQAKYLFMGGTLAMQAIDHGEGVKILKKTKELGLTTFVDTSWDSTGRWFQSIGSSLPYIDWFLPSIEEAKQMIGSSDPEELANKFRSHGAKNVVIKMGSKGVYVRPQDGKAFYIGIYDVPVVNTAGAGDAWCAGFIAGFVKELPLKECALLGAANSALAVTGTGTTNALRDYEETRKFMRETAYIEPEVQR
ncbi:kinase [Clostridia bacterium]|nr:kinase [Clostridia bacterium]